MSGWQAERCIALRIWSRPSRATGRTTNVRLARRTLIQVGLAMEGGVRGQIGGGGPRTAPITVQRYCVAP